MNRMFLALIVLCFTLGLVQASDQKNAPKSAPKGTTRVAVINLGAVLAKYEKANDFKAEMARNLKELQGEAKSLQADLAKWQAALQKNEFRGGTKEQYEEKVINGRRRLEDLSRTASLTVGKTQQAHLETLWNDMQEAVKEYCAENKIDLVFAYGDPKDNAGAFPNIDRKLRAADGGGAVPFFMNAGVDISEAVVELLNKKYRDAQAKPGDVD
jgi:Skp family chaperone for outer membrane proteins